MISAYAAPHDATLLQRAEQLADLPFYIIFITLVFSTYVSEDLTCATAGLLVARGHFDFLPATLACITGIFTGDLLLVLCGRFLNYKLLHRFPFNWIVSRYSIRSAEAWFRRKGPVAVFISRFIPGTRFPTYLTAGMLKMPLRQFSLYFLAASVLWTPILVGVSYKMGEQALPLMDRYAQYAPLILLSILLIIFLVLKILLPLVTHQGRRMLYSTWMRVTHWEFWPPWIFYLPLIPVMAWLMIRHRSCTVFTAANPMLRDGGFINESKAEILKALHPYAESTLPFCLLSAMHTTEHRLQLFDSFMKEHTLDYPVILKPDRGQRGTGVTVCRDREAAEHQLDCAHSDLIAQAYAPGKEYGVFYIRYPNAPCGEIFSITTKEMISVTGNGVATLRELILDDKRAVCMYQTHFDHWSVQLYDIPDEGEVIQLTELGTHCMGALFLNGNQLNTPALQTAIEDISSSIPGFFFGRYDIRCPDDQHLMDVKGLKIVELNGVTSEATHIYDPSFSLFSAYRVLYRQWAHAFAIGAENKALGHPVMGLRDLIQQVRDYRSLHSNLDSPDNHKQGEAS